MRFHQPCDQLPRATLHHRHTAPRAFGSTPAANCVLFPHIECTHHTMPGTLTTA